MQFLGKTLIINFNVATISFKIRSQEIYTNKWLQAFEWEEIYEKLDEILKKTKEVSLADLDMSSFRIDNYIEVYLKKASTSTKPFATMLGRKESELTPVYLKVYIKRLSSCKEEIHIPEITEVEIEVESTSVRPPRQPSKLLEYDPTVNGNGGSNLAYTPSNISKSNSEEAYTPSKVRSDASNSYVPKPISPPKRDYISSPELAAGTFPPQYKASKISKRERSQSPMTKNKRAPAKEERPKRTASSATRDPQKRGARSDDEEDSKTSTKKKKENVTKRKLYPPADIKVTTLDDGWKSSRSGKFVNFSPQLCENYLRIIYINTCCL